MIPDSYLIEIDAPLSIVRLSDRPHTLILYVAKMNDLEVVSLFLGSLGKRLPSHFIVWDSAWIVLRYMIVGFESSVGDDKGSISSVPAIVNSIGRITIPNWYTLKMALLTQS